jgi:hypothetical protein
MNENSPNKEGAMKRISTIARAARTEFFAFPAIAVVVLFTVSCVAAIPVAIKYAKSAG